MPVLFGDATQELTQKGSISKGLNQLFWIAIVAAFWYISYSCIKGFFLFLTRQTIIIMSRHIEFDLKNEVYEKYQQLDFQFLKRNSTGDLMNRISEDVAQVRQYLGPGIMYSLNLIVMFPFVCYQMFKISPTLTLYALAPLPIMTILIYFVSNRMNKLSKRVQEQQSKLSVISQETFAGMRVIKAYLQEKHSQKQFQEASNEYHKRNMRLVRTNALFMPTISLLIGTASLLTVYIGGNLTIEKTLNSGSILTFIMFVFQLTWPFASVGWVTSIIQRASASQTRINEFLKISPEIESKNDSVKENFESLRFENVSFHYSDSDMNVLKNINLELKKGESLGIVGRTGSGKSSLIQLMLRQMDATEGTVLINKTSIKNIDLSSLRNESAIVPQDVFLFSDSIRNNLLFGAKSSAKISEEETESLIKEVCESAHVLHNIEKFPEKFETLLGERGINLSGGQKQRLSIARALIRKPSLLLLDDCLSAVDTDTEDKILKNLKKFNEKYQTSSVIVSHRISALRNVDKIIVLQDGEIIEQGTHENLLETSGVYAQMYEKQLQEAVNEVKSEED